LKIDEPYVLKEK